MSILETFSRFDAHLGASGGFWCGSWVVLGWCWVLCPGSWVPFLRFPLWEFHVRAKCFHVKAECFHVIGNFRRRSIGLWSAHVYLQLSSIHCLQCEIRSIRWLAVLWQTYSCLSPSWYWFIPSVSETYTWLSVAWSWFIPSASETYTWLSVPWP